MMPSILEGEGGELKDLILSWFNKDARKLYVSMSEIEKGMSDVKAGRVYSADAIETEMKRDFGI